MVDGADGIKAANAAYWDANAPRWRSLSLPPEETIRALGVALGGESGSLVLDAGCGTGQWSVALARAGYRVRGLDISPQMVAAAQDRAHEYALSDDAAAFEVGALDEIGAPDASVDAIVSRLALDFVPHPGLALAELWRVLRPGGRLVLWVLGAASPVKRNDWRRFLPGEAAPVVRNQILPWEAEALLEALGWEIVAQAPGLEEAVSGAGNRYTAEMAAQLGDRVLQQAIATSWQFVARKA